MSLNVRPTQKLISFSESAAELDRISQEINEGGWAIISLMQNGKYYVGVMEKIQDNQKSKNEDATIYIPPRKKIKISY